MKLRWTEYRKVDNGAIQKYAMYGFNFKRVRISFFGISRGNVPTRWDKK